MKIVVTRAHLLPALAATSRAADRKNTIPILNNVLVQSDGEMLRVVGTNLDQEISASIPLLSGDAVASTLPAVHLHDAVKTLPESAEITITFDKTHATVTSGKARFRLPSLPSSDFFTMSADGWSHEFRIEAAALRAMFGSTSFAVSKAKDRIYLQGVYLHATADRLVAVATDGHRLARRFLPLPEGAAGMPGISLSMSAIGFIEGVCGDKGMVDVSMTSTRIRVASDAGSVISKLIGEPFPDYERAIPANNHRRFVVRRTAMDAAIARVLAISTARGSGVKFNFAAAGAVSLSTSGEEREATDEIESSVESDTDVAIGFGGIYARDVLSAVTTEDVAFVLADNASPIVIEPVGHSDQLFVIMPMRI